MHTWRLTVDSLRKFSLPLASAANEGDIGVTVAAVTGMFSALLAALMIMLSKTLAEDSLRLLLSFAPLDTNDLRSRLLSSSSLGLRNWFRFWQGLATATKIKRKNVLIYTKQFNGSTKKLRIKGARRRQQHQTSLFNEMGLFATCKYYIAISHMHNLSSGRTRMCANTKRPL